MKRWDSWQISHSWSAVCSIGLHSLRGPSSALYKMSVPDICAIAVLPEPPIAVAVWPRWRKVNACWPLPATKGKVSLLPTPINFALAYQVPHRHKFPMFHLNKLCRCVLALVTAGLLLSTSACESDDLEERLDRRNDTYQEFQDRRTLRRDARQERTDAWYDRVMGTGPSEPTGINLH